METFREKILGIEMNYKIVYLTGEGNIVNAVVLESDLEHAGVILHLASGLHVIIPWADLQDRFINTKIMNKEDECVGYAVHMAINKEQFISHINDEIKDLKDDIIRNEGYIKKIGEK